MMFRPYTPWLPESLSSNTQMIKKRNLDNLDKLDKEKDKFNDVSPLHTMDTGVTFIQYSND